VIHTRDMSWASSEQRIVDLLRTKARNDELTICLRQRTTVTSALESLGATIVTYDKLGFVPQSRFTVVRAGREDAEVAIGRSIKGVHTIATYSNGEHSVFALAQDLINVATKVNELP